MTQQAIAHYMELRSQGLPASAAAEHVWHLYGVQVKAR